MSEQEDLRLADWSLVPEILKILRTDYLNSLPSSRYLESYASWQKEDKNFKVILLTPGGKVNKFGTFVVYTAEHNYGIFHSLNPDCKEMELLLLKSKDIPWSDKPFFGPIHEKLHPALDELYIEKNMKVLIGDNVAHAWGMDVDQGKEITYTCPPNVYLGPLKEEQAEFIDFYWPHRGPLSGGNSAEVTRFMIRKNGGLGLYVKDSNELIGWCLIWAQNGPGQLYVLDEHKGKGYGTLIAKAITKFLAEKGVISLAFIHRRNTRSQNLFQKVGYKKLFGIQWSKGELQEN